MSRTVRWNPFQEIVDMQRQLDRVFDDINGRFADNNWSETGNWLALDLYDNENNYIVETELPGLNPDDINVTLHENTLTINATVEREELAEGERRILNERRFGHFQRSLRLPEAVDADKVSADYDNGVLTLTIAKSETSKPRQISIKPNSKLLTNEN